MQQRQPKALLAPTTARHKVPHRYLSIAINRGTVQSEVEGGVFLSDLALGSQLEVKTAHHSYVLSILGGGRVSISGHPDFCPQPTEVEILGSSWGGALLKSLYLGRGMRLEFLHPSHALIITSPILDLRKMN